MPVRRATTNDADAIYDLVVGMATSFRPEQASFKCAFESAIATPDALVIVVLDGDHVVGYLLGFKHATFYANGPVGWVEELAVSKSHQRKGFGRKLMSAFEQWSSDQGARLVGLATRRAGNFYQALGYEPSATYFRRAIARPT